MRASRIVNLGWAMGLIVLVCQSSLAYAQDEAQQFQAVTRAASRIEQVNLFRNAAEVIRRVEVTYEVSRESKGSALQLEVLIPDVPASVVQESVQVRNSSGLLLQAMEFLSDGISKAEQREHWAALMPFLTEQTWLSKRLADLPGAQRLAGQDFERLARLLQAQSESLAQRAAALKDRLAMLLSVQTSVSKGATAQIERGTLVAADFSDLIESAAEHRHQLGDQQASVVKERSMLTLRMRALEVLRAEHERREAAQDRRLRLYFERVGPSSSEPSAELGSSTVQTLQFDLRYRVQNTGWSPFYELGVDPEGDTATLKLFARVTQQSGEDWRGVRVNFKDRSLSALDQSGRLRPLRLSVSSQPQKTIAWNRQVSPDRLQVEEILGIDSAVSKREGVGPGLRPLPHSSRTRHRDDLLIMSTRFSSRIHIDTLELPIEFAWIAAPDAFNGVYRLGMLKNVSNDHLSAGPINILSEQQRHQMALWQGIAVGAEDTLNLGIDESLQVTRELLERNTAIANSRKRIELQYRFDVWNRGDQRLVNLLVRLPQTDMVRADPRRRVTVALLQSTLEPLASLPPVVWSQLRHYRRQMSPGPALSTFGVLPSRGAKAQDRATEGLLAFELDVPGRAASTLGSAPAPGRSSLSFKYAVTHDPGAALNVTVGDGMNN